MDCWCEPIKTVCASHCLACPSSTADQGSGDHRLLRHCSWVGEEGILRQCELRTCFNFTKVKTVELEC